MKNKDRNGRVSAFLVDAERRVDSMGLSTDVSGLVKAATRAILVADLPGREKATQQLYSPFQGVIPFESLTG